MEATERTGRTAETNARSKELISTFQCNRLMREKLVETMFSLNGVVGEYRLRGVITGSLAPDEQKGKA